MNKLVKQHPETDVLFQSISQLIQQARQQVQRNVNSVMVQSYWHIGRLIIEHEQQGETRAAYGKQQLQQLSERLSSEYGKGFDERNLRHMRSFYQAYPIWNAVRTELSWTHYRTLIRIENPSARDWYTNEAITENWSARALERQISVLYYERLLASKDRSPVEAEAKAQTAALSMSPQDYLRDPYILDFLNLESWHYQEADLKRGIINNLQQRVGWARPCAHAGVHDQKWMWAGNFVKAARACLSVTLCQFLPIDQAAVIAQFERWWDKYRVSLHELDVQVAQAEAAMKVYLVELGYE